MLDQDTAAATLDQDIETARTVLATEADGLRALAAGLDVV